MPALATNVDAILRDDYKDFLEQLNNECFVLAQVTTKKDTVEGKRAIHAIHTGRSGGIGARAEDQDLPTADRQRFAQVPVPVRYNTARIQLSQQVIDMASGKPASFVAAMEAEMEGIRNDSMRDIARQTWGTSNGVMATCGTTAASNTVQLLNTVPTSTSDAQMLQMYIGRMVDIGTVAAPTTVASARTITAVDVTNRTITIDGAAVSTTSGTHFIFNSGSGGASSHTGLPGDGQKELTGLQTIVDDSATLHTLTVAANPVWKAQVYSNSGTDRAFTELLVDKALLANATIAGKTVDTLVSNSGVFLSAKQLLSATYRNVDEIDFKGGFKGIKWSTPGISGKGARELGWFADFDAPARSLYGLNTSEGLVVHQVTEGWRWFDSDGAILSRVPNKLNLEAVAYTDMELACVQRNAHFVIKDITEA